MFGAQFSHKAGSGKEQLLRLYWNRASVKRELKALRDERHELIERLREQEGAIERAKEQLDGLERLLVNPIAAANAMVYFQLRNVWRVASQRLEQFSSDVEQQLINRERKALHESALSKRHRRLDAIHENICSLRVQHGEASERLRRLEAEFAAINPLLRFFKRRSSQAELDELRDAATGLSNQIGELEALGEKIQGEPLPELDGLSLEGRRMVNTALIALAQQLVLHFSGNNIALSAREAMHRSVGEMRFGDRRACDRMVENIRSRIADLKADTGLSEVVRNRAAIIAKDSEYRNASDSIPGVASVQTIVPTYCHTEHNRRSTDVPIKLNVLAEDLWDLSRYLR
jgi:chromosome segregation ATPase